MPTLRDTGAEFVAIGDAAFGHPDGAAAAVRAADRAAAAGGGAPLMRRAAVALAALCGHAAGALAAPAPDLAYGAYQRGLYVTAFREATARLERNPADAAAMTLLGELHNQGLGVAPDPAKAAEWYRLAARHGDGHALYALGIMAVDGRGMEQRPGPGPGLVRGSGRDGASPAPPTTSRSCSCRARRRRTCSEAVELLRRAADAEIGRGAARARRPLPQGPAA